jgi:hypothetical protein
VFQALVRLNNFEGGGEMCIGIYKYGQGKFSFMLLFLRKVHLSLIRSQNTGQLNVALYMIKHYCSTSCQDIIIPKRIHRGPTDILKVRGIVL